MDRAATDGGDRRPDWRPTAVRAGLELTLVVLSTTYLTLQVESALVSGVVLVVGIVASVAILFWSLDRHVYAWVRYASTQARRRQRARQRRTLREDDSE